ncbi:MAG: YihY/virulence factor BrkB family protein [Thermomicrobiales bacterium]
MRIPGLRGISPLDLGKRAVKGFMAHDMSAYAAALAYSALFSLFPFLIFLIAVLGFLHIPEFFTWLLNEGRRALPDSAYTLLDDTVDQVQGRASGGLLSVGIVAAVWGASSGVRALMNALNVAYEIDETRPAWKKYLYSVLYTFGFAAMLICLAALMLLGPRSMDWVADQVGLGSAFVTVWNILRWPVLVLLMIVIAALVYYVAPNVKQPFRLITPGSVLAVVLWLLASIGLSIYVSNFSNYSATYGSLAGVVILLFYLYVSSAVILLGAEVNAEVHKVELGTPVPDDTSGEPDGADTKAPDGEDVTLIHHRPVQGMPAS